MDVERWGTIIAAGIMLVVVLVALWGVVGLVGLICGLLWHQFALGWSLAP